jgi:hypothetical protein
MSCSPMSAPDASSLRPTACRMASLPGSPGKPQYTMRSKPPEDENKMENEHSMAYQGTAWDRTAQKGTNFVVMTCCWVCVQLRGACTNLQGLSCQGAKTSCKGNSQSHYCCSTAHTDCVKPVHMQRLQRPRPAWLLSAAPDWQPLPPRWAAQPACCVASAFYQAVELVPKSKLRPAAQQSQSHLA